MMRRFAALVAVLFVAGTAAAVPMGTETIYVEVQGNAQAFSACTTVTFADQTYNVFGVDVNLGTAMGGMVGFGDQTSSSFTSYPDASVFAFAVTAATVCANPPDCTSLSFVTSSISNMTGSLPASLGPDVAYSVDGQIALTGTSANPTIPGCPLVGSVYTVTGSGSINAFQTQTTSVSPDPQTVTFPQTTFLSPLTDQVVAVDVGVTFSQVTSGGTTTVTATSNAAGTIPANFVAGGNGYNATFLDVSTTAAVQPPIVVCSTYPDTDNDGFIDGTSPPVPESALSFLHGEGDPKVFVDRTFSRDPISNIICAQVDSLSPFVLAVNVPPTPTPTNTPTATPTLAAGCPHVPDGTCSGAGKSSVLLKTNENPSRQQFAWKWSKGIDQLVQSDFGDPVNGSTNYRVCVYDQTAATPQFKMGLSIAPSGLCAGVPCWKALGDKGWSYTNSAGNTDAITKVRLKGGAAGKPQVQVKGKGVPLPLPAPESPTAFFAQDPAVIVQLYNSSSSACWSSTFAASSTKKNDGEGFKATTP